MTNICTYLKRITVRFCPPALWTWYLPLLVLSAMRVPAQTGMEFPERYVLPGDAAGWDTGRIVRAVAYIRKAELSKKRPDSVFHLMRQTLAASEGLSFTYGIASSLYWLGNAYASKSLDIEAEAMYRQAVPYCIRDTRVHRLLPLISGNLGKLYHIRGDFRKAADLYYQGIVLGENHFPDTETDHLYSNLAAVLIQMGHPPEQVRYYLDKSEAASRKNRNYYVLGNMLVNKGIIYKNGKTWDSSIRYYREALDVAQEHRFPQVAYLALANMGILYLEKGMPGQAVGYLREAEAVAQEHHIDLAYQNNTATMLGAAYMQLNRHREAEQVLRQAANRAVLLNQPPNIREAHWQLARLYGTTGDYKKAYQHAQAYMSMNDSLAGEEIIKNINQTEVKFRTAEKDREIMRKQLLITRQERDIGRKNFWITITASGALMIILVSIGLYGNHLSKRRLLAAQLSRLEQQQEIERLKAMMKGEENERNRIARELHDGIGGLIAAAQLNASALKKDNGGLEQSDAYGKLTDILDNIGNEVRKTAHNMMPEILLHHSLPEAIRHFCRYIGENRSLHIDVQAYGSFERLTDAYRLPVYRIVQELIHNVVKHAGADHALVQIMLQHPVLSITVEDNGRGFNTEQAQWNHGAGLASLHARVQSLNGTCSLKSMPGKGTSVYVEITLPGKEDSPKNPTLQQETC